MPIGYDVDLLKEIRDAKTKRTMDQQLLQNTGQEAVAGIHAKATTDQANIHWQTQKDLRQQIIDADKPLKAEEVTGMKIKNDLTKQFGARDIEARVGHEEIVGKNAAYNYNMATKVPEGNTFSYGESKIRDELALQQAGTDKILGEASDAATAKDTIANTLGMQKANTYLTNQVEQENVAAVGFGNENPVNTYPQTPGFPKPGSYSVTPNPKFAKPENTVTKDLYESMRGRKKYYNPSN